VYVVPMLLIASLNFAIWAGDVVMYAIKTRLMTVFALTDFLFGVGLTYLLVERYQVNALIYVPLVNAVFRIFVSYALNHRFCFPQRFYFWQSIAAPLLAGGVHYLWLRWFTGLIWQHDELTSILSLLFGLVVSYPVYGFLYGFFGGWDDNTLAEFGRGTLLSSFMKPMARLFYHSNRLGARFSPLHGRFPITNFAAARAEAEGLTAERVKLLRSDVSPDLKRF
jgi:hypothetical protein